MHGTFKMEARILTGVFNKRFPYFVYKLTTL